MNIDRECVNEEIQKISLLINFKKTQGALNSLEDNVKNILLEWIPYEKIDRYTSISQLT